MSGKGWIVLAVLISMPASVSAGGVAGVFTDVNDPQAVMELRLDGGFTYSDKKVKFSDYYVLERNMIMLNFMKMSGREGDINMCVLSLNRLECSDGRVFKGRLRQADIRSAPASGPMRGVRSGPRSRPSDRYVMRSDAVTMIELVDEKNFIYDDVTERHSSEYSRSGRKLILNFKGKKWRQKDTMECEMVGKTLQCDDGEVYVKPNEFPSGSIYGRYVSEIDPRVILALEKNGGYIYKTGTTEYVYSYNIEGSKVTLNFAYGSPFKAKTMECNHTFNALNCSDGVKYIKN